MPDDHDVPDGQDSWRGGLWPCPTTAVGKVAESAMIALAIGYVVGLICSLTVGVMVGCEAAAAAPGGGASAVVVFAWTFLKVAGVFSALGAVVFATIAGVAVSLSESIDWLSGRIHAMWNSGRPRATQ